MFSAQYVAVCYITSLYFVNNKSDLCNVSVIFFCFVVNFSIVHVFFGLVKLSEQYQLPCVTSTRSALELNLVP